MLSDLEKVQLLRSYFSTKDMDILNDDKLFASYAKKNNPNINEDSFYKLLRKWNGLSLKSNLQSRTKEKLSSIFNLRFDIWKDSFNNEREFINSIPFYETKNFSDIKKIDTKKIWNETVLTKDEEEILANLNKNKNISIPANIDNYTPNFKFELAKLLKNKKQFKDSYTILEKIENDYSNSFKYIFKSEIDHFKAILLSTNDFKEWDRAIDILKYLFASKYYLQEPEIITLLASNYKRKAIFADYGLKPKEYIDIDTLMHSLSLYKMAYNSKSNNEKYYDAINIAYLILILDSLETNKEIETIKPKEEIEKLYKDSFSKIENSNWWVTITKVEFLFLLEKFDEAIAELDAYGKTVTLGDLEATIRQLEILKFYVPKMANDIDGFISELKSKFG